MIYVIWPVTSAGILSDAGVACHAPDIAAVVDELLSQHADIIGVVIDTQEALACVVNAGETLIPGVNINAITYH